MLKSDICCVTFVVYYLFSPFNLSIILKDWNASLGHSITSSNSDSVLCDFFTLGEMRCNPVSKLCDWASLGFGTLSYNDMSLLTYITYIIFALGSAPCGVGSIHIDPKANVVSKGCTKIPTRNSGIILP
eukprot:Tbor_TRINITY_DN5710_c0_g1::TRINITY_DN5710_c0_g1_i2::g.20177::m.20177